MIRQSKNDGGIMKPLIIEIDAENATMCLANGGGVSGSEYETDILDCVSSGDCQGACEYVLDQIGVEFCIVAKNAAGDYENRQATPAEKQATCETIYFESETDYSGERWADIYLTWEACHGVQSGGE